MATSNFYQSGNHGLNVIDDTEDEFIVEDTLANIVADLSSKGYSTDSIRIDTPRSFDTGKVFAIFNNKSKVVAILELCAGYYSGANINIYTEEHLDDEYDREDRTHNKRDVKRVVDVVKSYTVGYNRVATFSNGETIYERSI